jgi:anthranilate phosphoribosyltransferase
MKMEMRDILDALGSRQDLSAGQAAYGFGQLFEGLLTPAQAGAMLMGLRAKGETPLELAEAGRAGLAKARLVADIPRDKPILDIVGTGGDRTSSFNCSTAVSLYLAALGHRVVKHGNRAVSSSSGSADALEGLGISLAVKPDDVPAELAKTGFVFLFAPNYHPAFAHIAPVRRELGVRTLFNLMGPLLNPARPSHQVLGVGNAASLPLMAQTLALLDPKVRAFVFHGAGGFDELTPFGPASVLLVENGQAAEVRFDPAEFGYLAADFDPEAVRVLDKPSAVAALKDVLCGRGNPAMQAMTALNLGAALHLATGKALAACVAEAKAAVADGAARSFANA